MSSTKDMACISRVMDGAALKTSHLKIHLSPFNRSPALRKQRDGALTNRCGRLNFHHMHRHHRRPNHHLRQSSRCLTKPLHLASQHSKLASTLTELLYFANTRTDLSSLIRLFKTASEAPDLSSRDSSPAWRPGSVAVRPPWTSQLSAPLPPVWRTWRSTWRSQT